ncbi:MAG: TIR domain-containing protein [Gammaproteobacteria bacterium]|nr:TIR domain-containing protein [Gammaproteobacteria bacterium]
MEYANTRQDDGDVTREFISAAAGRASAYISYDPVDENEARSLCQVIERRGLPCWFSARDVKPDMAWPQCVVEAIETCPVMVVMLTDAAIKAGHVVSEIEQARAQDHRVLVLNAAQERAGAELEFLLSTERWLDVEMPMTAANHEAAWKAVADIEMALFNEIFEASNSLADTVPGEAMLLRVDGTVDAFKGRRMYQLTAGSRLLLGRSKHADLLLADARSSRRHAALEVRRNDKGSLELHLVDLNSTNGTWLRYRRDGDDDMSRLLKDTDARMVDGSVIRIGSTDIYVQLVPVPSTVAQIA